MPAKTNTESAVETPAEKPKKVTARDQGIPEVYLSESGSFKPGYDAKLKSDLIVAVLGDGRLHTFDADEAMQILTSRGWLQMLETSRVAREKKNAKSA
jgi:hypothetical protein